MGIISTDFVLNWEHCVKSYMASVNINMMTCVPYVKRIERAVDVTYLFAKICEGLNFLKEWFYVG